VFRQTIFRNGTCCALLLTFLAAATAQATTILPLSFQTLVRQADLIFTGRALNQRAEWREFHGKKSIVTLVTFAVERAHKGQAEATVTLQFLGGKIGDTELLVSEMPEFKPGERVVLFVAENGTAVCPVIGFYHGKFSVRRAASGVEEVLSGRGEPLIDVHALGVPKRAEAKSSRVLSHNEFIARIHEQLAVK
jgi:hypothetical protein